MAAGDTLSMTLELKDNLSKQIQQDTKDTEKLAAAIKELNVDLSKLSAEKLEKNLNKNLNDAEKSLFRILEAKEKVDKALSRNMAMRSEGFAGINETELLKISGRLDEIIEKVLNIGPSARFSGNAIKDLLASLSTDVTLKSALNESSLMDKGLEKQARERAKAEKEAAKEIGKAFDDADKAAKNNVKNQELVKDAMARIATARAKLSAASNSASMEDQAHARLLMSLLDQLSTKLGNLKGEFLGEKGALDGILGSGLKGLLRNVDVSIRNMLNGSGMSDSAWEAAKREAEARSEASAAAEKHKKKLEELNDAFDKQARAEQQATAQQERANARQQAFYQSQQRATQATRQRAEELVRLRMELLRTQAAELQGMLKNGKGVFSAQQYQEVQDALLGIRREMRQLEGVMQNLSSYSIRDLFGFGRGTQNWAPLISNGQQILNTISAVRQLSMEEEKLMQSIDKASQAFNNQNRVLSDLNAMTRNYLSLWGAKDFLNNIIQIGGQLEMQRLSIGAILGDTAHANDLFEKIKALAVQSPFGVVELDQYTKQLSAYGFKYNELYDMTKRLADISAGAGTDVGRLALALGHVRSEAALSGYTLRQFAMNNIPMVGELSKLLTETEGKIVSVADVRKRVRNKEIGYEEVETVIKRLTDQGGMFYNMQEVVSQSVKARFKNLKDSLDIMYGEIAESDIGGALKGVAVTLTNLSRHWKELFAVVQTGIIILGSYKAVMLANTLMLGREAAAVNVGIAAKERADKANIKLASSYRLLTAEEMRFNGISGEALVMANALALSEKKLTAEGLARQVALGKLTKAEAMQVVALADLTATERLHAQAVVGNVFTYGRFTGVINRITMSVKGLSVALKGLLWNPLTAIFAVAGIATEMWQKNNEEVERAQELNDSLFERATEGIRNIKQMMEETGMSFTVNGVLSDFSDIDSLKNGEFEFAKAADLSTAEMISAIEKWSQFIKEYSANPNNILNNSFLDENGKVRDLAEQYELLGKAVGETAEAYVWLKQASDATQFAEDLSNGGWLDDDLVGNINDYAQDVKDYNDAISISVKNNRQFWSVVMKAARAHAGFAGTLKREGIDAENLSAQIKVLIEDQERYAGALDLAEKAAKEMGLTLSEFERTTDSYLPYIGYDTSIQDYFVSMSESRKTMEADMDEWIAGMKQRLQDLGWSINDLSEGQKQAVALAIAETVAKANKGTDAIRKDVEKLMKEKFGIPIDADTAQAVAQIAGLKKSLSDLVGHDWTIDVKATSNFGDVIDKIRKAHKGAKEYFENSKPLAIKMGIDVSGGLKELGSMQRDAMIKKWKAENPGMDSTMYEQFLEQWDKMAKEMNDAMDFSKATGISLTDPNKSKSSGNKTDEQLKKWKERKKALDDYYKLYQEYSKYMTDQEAIEKINATGLIKGQALPKNINDYLSMMKEFMDSIGEKNINTTERQTFWDGLIGDYNKKDFEKNTKEVIDALVKQLDEELKTRGKQWNLYKKILDVTGNKDQAAQVAFGGAVRFDNFAEQLRSEISEALEKNAKANSFTIDQLLGMDDNALKKIDIFKNGTDGVYTRLKKLEEVEMSLQSQDIDLFVEAIKSAKSLDTELNQIRIKYENLRAAVMKDKNATPEQKATLIGNLDSEQSKAEADKRWEWFKKTEDWGRIFANLDRVSNETISFMLTELEELAPKISKSAESTKALYEAMEKLREQQLTRNPFKAIGESLSKQSVISKYLSDNRKVVANAELSSLLGVNLGSTVNLGSKNVKRKLKDAGASENINFLKGLDKVHAQFKALQGVLQPVIDLFDSLGDKTLSGIFSAGNNALGSAASTAQAFSTLGKSFGGSFGAALGNAGPYGAAAAAALSLASSALDMFGADYADYENMKAQYESLIGVWDDLIDRKREYLNESWGTEAKAAGKEALELLKSEVEQTKVIARARLDSGASLGSHSMAYRMWRGSYSYEGKNWKDVAYEISQQLGGVKFTEMEDMLNMTQEQLLWIKKNYSGLWATMDGDFQSYLDKLIKYGDTEKDLLDDLSEKLTGMEFSDLLSSYASTLSTMENGNKELGNNLEENLKNAILNAMVANVYGERIKALMKLTEDLGSNDQKEYENDKVLSEYTQSEYERIKSESDILNEAMAASRDRLKDLYGWKDDDSSSSSTSSSIGKAITEQDTSLWSSYINAIRADVSVNRLTLDQILAAVNGLGGESSIAQSQLEQLKNIAKYTLRNAEAAESISNLLHSLAPDGQSIRMK